MRCNFEKEIVALNSQLFGSVQMNYLKSFCISVKHFSKIKMSELVYQSERVEIIHISSVDRGIISLCIID